MQDGSTKVSVPKVEMFKGKPVLCLNPNEQWPFSFGLQKAKLILANIDAIKSFVDSMDAPSTPTT
jgi:hypothetical protein